MREKVDLLSISGSTHVRGIRLRNQVGLNTTDFGLVSSADRTSVFSILESTSMNMSINPQFSQGSVGGAGESGGNQKEIEALQKQIKGLEDQIAAKGQQGSGGAQGGGGEEDPLQQLLKMLQEQLQKLMGGQGAGGGGDSAGGQGGGGQVQAIVEQSKMSVGF